MPTTAVDTYSLTQEQLDFRDTIRQIVRERVAPRAAEIDAKAEYPWDIRRLFAEQDLMGLPFPEEYGGTGTGTLMLNVAIEEVARACASSAMIADFYVVFAVTDREAKRSSAFVVEKDRPGFSVPKLEHKLGIKGSPTGSPVFEDVRVPAENLVGVEGKGYSMALAVLERTRLGAAAQAVGIAQGATDYGNGYAKERLAFGAPIHDLQGIQFKF